MKERFSPHRIHRPQRNVFPKRSIDFEVQDLPQNEMKNNDSVTETIFVNGTQEDEERGEKDYPDDNIFKINNSFTSRILQTKEILTKESVPKLYLTPNLDVDKSFINSASRKSSNLILDADIETPQFPSSGIDNEQSPSSSRKQKRHINRRKIKLNKQRKHRKRSNSSLETSDSFPSLNETYERMRKIDIIINETHIEENESSDEFESSTLFQQTKNEGLGILESSTLLPQKNYKNCYDEAKDFENSALLHQANEEDSIKLSGNFDMALKEVIEIDEKLDESLTLIEKTTIPSKHLKTKDIFPRTAFTLENMYSSSTSENFVSENENSGSSKEAYSNIMDVLITLTEHPPLKHKTAKYNFIKRSQDNTYSSNRRHKIKTKPKSDEESNILHSVRVGTVDLHSTERVSITDNTQYENEDDDDYLDIQSPFERNHRKRIVKRREHEYKNKTPNLTYNENKTQYSNSKVKYDRKYNRMRFHATSTAFWRSFNWPDFEESFDSVIQDSNQLLKNDVKLMPPSSQADFRLPFEISSSSPVGADENKNENFEKIENEGESKTESLNLYLEMLESPSVNGLESRKQTESSFVEKSAMNIINDDQTLHLSTAKLPKFNPTSDLKFSEILLRDNDYEIEAKVEELTQLEDKNTKSLLSFNWPEHFEYTTASTVEINSEPTASENIEEESTTEKTTLGKPNTKSYETVYLSSHKTIKNYPVTETHRTRLQKIKDKANFFKHFIWPNHETYTTENHISSEELNRKAITTTENQMNRTVETLFESTYQKEGHSTKTREGNNYTKKFTSTAYDTKELRHSESVFPTETEKYNVSNSQTSNTNNGKKSFLAHLKGKTNITSGSERKTFEQHFNWPDNEIFENEGREKPLTINVAEKNKTKNLHDETLSFYKFNWPDQDNFDYAFSSKPLTGNPTSEYSKFKELFTTLTFPELRSKKPTRNIWGQFQWPEHETYREKTNEQRVFTIPTSEEWTLKEETTSSVGELKEMWDQMEKKTVFPAKSEYPTKLTLPPTKSTTIGELIEMVEDIANFKSMPEEKEETTKKGRKKISPHHKENIQVTESEDDDGLWNFRLLEPGEVIVNHEKTRKPFLKTATIYSFKPIGPPIDEWHEFNEDLHEKIFTEPTVSKTTKSTFFIWKTEPKTSPGFDEDLYNELVTLTSNVDRVETSSEYFNPETALETTTSPERKISSEIYEHLVPTEGVELTFNVSRFTNKFLKKLTVKMQNTPVGISQTPMSKEETYEDLYFFPIGEKTASSLSVSKEMQHLTESQVLSEQMMSFKTYSTPISAGKTYSEISKNITGFGNSYQAIEPGIETNNEFRTLYQFTESLKPKFQTSTKWLFETNFPEPAISESTKSKLFTWKTEPESSTEFDEDLFNKLLTLTPNVDNVETTSEFFNTETTIESTTSPERKFSSSIYEHLVPTKRVELAFNVSSFISKFLKEFTVKMQNKTKGKSQIPMFDEEIYKELHTSPFVENTDSLMSVTEEVKYEAGVQVLSEETMLFKTSPTLISAEKAYSEIDKDNTESANAYQARETGIETNNEFRTMYQFGETLKPIFGASRTNMFETNFPEYETEKYEEKGIYEMEKLKEKEVKQKFVPQKLYQTTEESDLLPEARTLLMEEMLRSIKPMISLESKPRTTVQYFRELEEFTTKRDTYLKTTKGAIIFDEDYLGDFSVEPHKIIEETEHVVEPPSLKLLDEFDREKSKEFPPSDEISTTEESLEIFDEMFSDISGTVFLESPKQRGKELKVHDLGMTSTSKPTYSGFRHEGVVEDENFELDENLFHLSERPIPSSTICEICDETEPYERHRQHTTKIISRFNPTERELNMEGYDSYVFPSIERLPEDKYSTVSTGAMTDQENLIPKFSTFPSILESPKQKGTKLKVHDLGMTSTSKPTYSGFRHEGVVEDENFELDENLFHLSERPIPSSTICEICDETEPYKSQRQHTTKIISRFNPTERELNMEGYDSYVFPSIERLPEDKYSTVSTGAMTDQENLIPKFSTFPSLYEIHKPSTIRSKQPQNTFFHRFIHTTQKQNQETHEEDILIKEEYDNNMHHFPENLKQESSTVCQICDEELQYEADHIKDNLKTQKIIFPKDEITPFTHIQKGTEINRPAPTKHPNVLVFKHRPTTIFPGRIPTEVNVHLPQERSTKENFQEETVEEIQSKAYEIETPISLNKNLKFSSIIPFGGKLESTTEEENEMKAEQGKEEEFLKEVEHERISSTTEYFEFSTYGKASFEEEYLPVDEAMLLNTKMTSYSVPLEGLEEFETAVSPQYTISGEKNIDTEIPFIIPSEENDYTKKQKFYGSKVNKGQLTTKRLNLFENLISPIVDFRSTSEESEMQNRASSVTGIISPITKERARFDNVYSGAKTTESMDYKGEYEQNMLHLPESKQKETSTLCEICDTETEYVIASTFFPLVSTSKNTVLENLKTFESTNIKFEMKEIASSSYGFTGSEINRPLPTKPLTILPFEMNSATYSEEQELKSGTASSGTISSVTQKLNTTAEMITSTIKLYSNEENVQKLITPIEGHIHSTEAFSNKIPQQGITSPERNIASLETFSNELIMLTNETTFHTEKLPHEESSQALITTKEEQEISLGIFSDGKILQEFLTTLEGKSTAFTNENSVQELSSSSKGEGKTFGSEFSPQDILTTTEIITAFMETFSIENRFQEFNRITQSYTTSIEEFTHEKELEELISSKEENTVSLKAFSSEIIDSTTAGGKNLGEITPKEFITSTKRKANITKTSSNEVTIRVTTGKELHEIESTGQFSNPVNYETLFEDKNIGTSSETHGLSWYHSITTEGNKFVSTNSFMDRINKEYEESELYTKNLLESEIFIDSSSGRTTKEMEMFVPSVLSKEKLLVETDNEYEMLHLPHGDQYETSTICEICSEVADVHSEHNVLMSTTQLFTAKDQSRITFVTLPEAISKQLNEEEFGEIISTKSIDYEEEYESDMINLPKKEEIQTSTICEICSDVVDIHSEQNVQMSTSQLYTATGPSRETFLTLPETISEHTNKEKFDGRTSTKRIEYEEKYERVRSEQNVQMSTTQLFTSEYQSRERFPTLAEPLSEHMNEKEYGEIKSTKYIDYEDEYQNDMLNIPKHEKIQTSTLCEICDEETEVEHVLHSSTKSIDLNENVKLVKSTSGTPEMARTILSPYTFSGIEINRPLTTQNPDIIPLNIHSSTISDLSNTGIEGKYSHEKVATKMKDITSSTEFSSYEEANTVSFHEESYKSKLEFSSKLKAPVTTGEHIANYITEHVDTNTFLGNDEYEMLHLPQVGQHETSTICEICSEVEDKQMSLTPKVFTTQNFAQLFHHSSTKAISKNSEKTEYGGLLSTEHIDYVEDNNMLKLPESEKKETSTLCEICEEETNFETEQYISTLKIHLDNNTETLKFTKLTENEEEIINLDNIGSKVNEPILTQNEGTMPFSIHSTTSDVLRKNEEEYLFQNLMSTPTETSYLMEPLQLDNVTSENFTEILKQIETVQNLKQPSMVVTVLPTDFMEINSELNFNVQPISEKPIDETNEDYLLTKLLDQTDRSLMSLSPSFAEVSTQFAIEDVEKIFQNTEKEELRETDRILETQHLLATENVLGTSKQSLKTSASQHTEHEPSEYGKAESISSFKPSSEENLLLILSTHANEHTYNFKGINVDRPAPTQNTNILSFKMLSATHPSLIELLKMKFEGNKYRPTTHENTMHIEPFSWTSGTLTEEEPHATRKITEKETGTSEMEEKTGEISETETKNENTVHIEPFSVETGTLEMEESQETGKIKETQIENESTVHKEPFSVETETLEMEELLATGKVTEPKKETVNEEKINIPRVLQHTTPISIYSERMLNYSEEYFSIPTDFEVHSEIIRTEPNLVNAEQIFPLYSVKTPEYIAKATEQPVLEFTSEAFLLQKAKDIVEKIETENRVSILETEVHLATESIENGGILSSHLNGDTTEMSKQGKYISSFTHSSVGSVADLEKEVALTEKTEKYTEKQFLEEKFTRGSPKEPTTEPVTSTDHALKLLIPNKLNLDQESLDNAIEEILTSSNTLMPNLHTVEKEFPSISMETGVLDEKLQKLKDDFERVLATTIPYDIMLERLEEVIEPTGHKLLTQAETTVPLPHHIPSVSTLFNEAKESMQNEETEISEVQTKSIDVKTEPITESRKANTVSTNEESYESNHEYHSKKESSVTTNKRTGSYVTENVNTNTFLANDDYEMLHLPQVGHHETSTICEICSEVEDKQMSSTPHFFTTQNIAQRFRQSSTVPFSQHISSVSTLFNVTRESIQNEETEISELKSKTFDVKTEHITESKDENLEKVLLPLTFTENLITIRENEMKSSTQKKDFHTNISPTGSPIIEHRLFSVSSNTFEELLTSEAISSKEDEILESKSLEFNTRNITESKDKNLEKLRLPITSSENLATIRESEMKSFTQKKDSYLFSTEASIIDYGLFPVSIDISEEYPKSEHITLKEYDNLLTRFPELSSNEIFSASFSENEPIKTHTEIMVREHELKGTGSASETKLITETETSSIQKEFTEFVASNETSVIEHEEFLQSFYSPTNVFEESHSKSPSIEEIIHTEILTKANLEESFLATLIENETTETYTTNLLEQHLSKAKEISFDIEMITEIETNLKHETLAEQVSTKEITEMKHGIYLTSSDALGQSHSTRTRSSEEEILHTQYSTEYNPEGSFSVILSKEDEILLTSFPELSSNNFFPITSVENETIKTHTKTIFEQIEVEESEGSSEGKLTTRANLKQETVEGYITPTEMENEIFLTPSSSRGESSNSIVSFLATLTENAAPEASTNIFGRHSSEEIKSFSDNQLITDKETIFKHETAGQHVPSIEHSDIEHNIYLTSPDTIGKSHPTSTGLSGKDVSHTLYPTESNSEENFLITLIENETIKGFSKNKFDKFELRQKSTSEGHQAIEPEVTMQHETLEEHVASTETADKKHYTVGESSDSEKSFLVTIIENGTIQSFTETILDKLELQKATGSSEDLRTIESEIDMNQETSAEYISSTETAKMEGEILLSSPNTIEELSNSERNFLVTLIENGTVKAFSENIFDHQAASEISVNMEQETLASSNVGTQTEHEIFLSSMNTNSEESFLGTLIENEGFKVSTQTTDHELNPDEKILATLSENETSKLSEERATVAFSQENSQEYSKIPATEELYNAISSESVGNTTEVNSEEIFFNTLIEEETSNTSSETSGFSVEMTEFSTPLKVLEEAYNYSTIAAEQEELNTSFAKNNSEESFLGTLIESEVTKPLAESTLEEQEWYSKDNTTKGPTVDKISGIPLLTTLLLSLVASSTQHPQTNQISGHYQMKTQENGTFPKCLVVFFSGENSNNSMISLNGTKWIPSEKALFAEKESTPPLNASAFEIAQSTEIASHEAGAITTESFEDIESEETELSSAVEMTTQEIVDTSNFVQGGCTEMDFENNNNCFCMLDLTVDHVAGEFQTSNSSNLNRVECSKFLKVNTGLIIKDEKPTLERKKRSYLYLRYHNRKKREIVEYNNLDEVLANELVATNIGEKIYSAVGASASIPCVPKDEGLEREHFTKYVWTSVEDKAVPLSDRVREATDGVLKISDVSVKDGGNYTCSVNRPFGTTDSEPKRYRHELMIAERPIFKIKTTIMYNTDEACSLKLGDIIHNHLPKLLEELLCGLHKRVCRVEMERPNCVPMEDDTYLSFKYVVALDPLPLLMPSLTYNKCDFDCQMKIYGSLLSLLVKNVETINFLNIISETQTSNRTFKPREIKFPTDRKTVEDTTLFPVLLIGCPPGFGIQQKTNKICVACPRNSYSADNSSSCVPCPFIHFQPNLGSTGCIECQTPFEDESCVGMVLANRSFLIIYIGSSVAIIFLILLCVFCVQSVGTPPSKKKKTSQISKRRRIGRKDIEDPAEKTFLLKDTASLKVVKGPKVPPPDF